MPGNTRVKGGGARVHVCEQTVPQKIYRFRGRPEGGRSTKGEKARQELTARSATTGARKTSFGAKPSSRGLLARRAFGTGNLRVGCWRARETAAPREMVTHAALHAAPQDRTRLIDLPFFCCGKKRNMILNYDHYRSGQRKKRPKWLIPAVALAVVGAGVLLFALKVPQKIFSSSTTRAGAGRIPALWKAEKYDEVISVADAVLKNDPLNAGTLAYRGFASFYKSISEINAEDKVPFLDDAVICLRRAKLAGTAMNDEVDYVLAKSYFFKGKFYYDLAISCMTRAIAHGFVQNDSYEYLGLAYSQLGELEKAIDCFLEALHQGQTDILLLTIGQTYYQMKRTGDAVDYLMRTLNKTEDKAIEKKARSLLGEIYLDRNELFKAEEQYSLLTKLDPQSADAHFYLGEVYSKMNDRVKARAEWRAAFQIDPSHYGARLRLFK